MICKAVLEILVSKFIGQMEHNQSTTKFLAQWGNAIRVGAHKTRDQNVKRGDIDCVF